MKSLFEENSKQGLHRRLAMLKPDQRPLWGRMNSTQMLSHLADALRMGLGELPTNRKKGVMRYPPFKQIIIYWMPWPKGAPTAPELISRQSDNWGAEREAVVALIDRFGARGADQNWPEHPLFGRLSGKAWGILSYRHIDHHFRQFGV